MNNRPFKKHLLCLSVTILMIAVLLNGCSKPIPVKPDVALLAHYELRDIRYLFKTGDRVDTTILQLKGLSVQNLGSTLSTQQLAANFGDLSKTSLFSVDQQD